MIILFLLIWSLCAVYITHFLKEKKMKTAAMAYTVLYCYVVAWTYLIFFMDIVRLGFEESRSAAIFGSNIYHGFVAFGDMLETLPENMLIAIIIVCITGAVSVFAVLALGGVQLYKALRRLTKKSRKDIIRVRPKLRRSFSAGRVIRIYITNCRLNC